MRVKVTDVKLKENQDNVFQATLSSTAPNMDKFVVECIYKPAAIDNPLDLPYFAISNESKVLFQSKGFTVRIIMHVLKPAVIAFAEHMK